MRNTEHARLATMKGGTPERGSTALRTRVRAFCSHKLKNRKTADTKTPAQGLTIYYWPTGVASGTSLHDFYVDLATTSTPAAVLVPNCPVPQESDLGRAMGRGMRTTTDEGRVMNELAENKGGDLNQMSDNLHAIKAGGSDNPDVIFSHSGDVYDNMSGDLLGNLLQG
jgi:hypothetical protein